MAARIRFRRGTNTQHNSFTGAAGEITVNTTNNSAHIHDGSTAGGYELCRADLDNLSSSAVIPGSQVDSLDGGTY